MFGFLKSFGNRCTMGRRKTRPTRSLRLDVELLEGRLVPSTISALSWQSPLVNSPFLSFGNLNLTHHAVYGIGPGQTSERDAFVSTDGGGFVDLGGYVKAISAGLDAKGNPEVYGIGADDALYVNKGSGWVDLGGICKAVSATAKDTVYVIGTDNSVFVNVGGSGYTGLGGYALDISAGLDANGNPEVYAIGLDHALYVNNGTGWVDLGGYVKAISATTHNTVYVIGSDNSVFVNAGSGYTALGGYALQISAGLDTNGNPEVFVIGSDHALYLNHGSGYVDLGGYVQDIAAPAVGVGVPGDVAYGIGSDGACYLNQGGVYTNLGFIAVKVTQQTFETFDTGNFNLDTGLFAPAVQGSAELTVYANGGYHFTGHFHDSGWLSYKDSLVFGIVSPSGVLYSFTHTGSVAGKLEFWKSHDDNWDVSGIDPAISAGWQDLQGAQSYWKADASWDWIALLQEIKDAAEIVKTVIEIV
jgi:Tectonin domain